MAKEREESVIVVAYKGQGTADQVYDTLRGLQKEKKVKIKTAAVVTRRENGKLKVNHKRRITVGKGLVGGAILGLLVFGTGGGILAVGTVGALVGATGSSKRSKLKDFLDDKLGQDDSVLAVQVSNADWDAIRAATEQVYGRGEVLSMELTAEDEAELNALAENEEVVAAVAEEIVVEDDPEVEVVEEEA
jgi:uncharacterized membrane protein